MATVKDNVKILSVGGVLPSEESIKNGTYSVQRPFVLVTKKDTKLSKSAQDFFEWATSEKASDVIKAAGVVAAH